MHSPIIRPDDGLRDGGAGGEPLLPLLTLGPTTCRPTTKLVDESGRLAALQRYEILDTAAAAPFDRITAVVRSLLNVPICVVSLVDADRQWFLSRQGLAAQETCRSASFCTHTIRKRQPMIVPDARLDERFRDSALVTGPPFIISYAGVPLETPDFYNIGALCAIDTAPRQFDDGQIEALKGFASLVMNEMELRQIAQSDHLTGALTRRAFIAEADRALARFNRYRRPSALILLDIDHFKRINDTYGHAAGDDVLRTLSACCTRLLRDGDVLGRVGGEEFAILLAESEAAEALVAAERFREAIAALPMRQDEVLRMTASFGVAPLALGCTSAEQWLALADTGLYAAKEGGRNRCCLAMMPCLSGKAG